MYVLNVKTDYINTGLRGGIYASNIKFIEVLKLQMFKRKTKLSVSAKIKKFRLFYAYGIQGEELIRKKQAFENFH